jgi:hypothetical protein
MRGKRRTKKDKSEGRKAMNFLRSEAGNKEGERPRERREEKRPKGSDSGGNGRRRGDKGREDDRLNINL